jgi:hypothetical protein
MRSSGWIPARTSASCRRDTPGHWRGVMEGGSQHQPLWHAYCSSGMSAQPDQQPASCDRHTLATLWPAMADLPLPSSTLITLQNQRLRAGAAGHHYNTGCRASRLAAALRRSVALKKSASRGNSSSAQVPCFSHSCACAQGFQVWKPSAAQCTPRFAICLHSVLCCWGGVLASFCLGRRE